MHVPPYPFYRVAGSPRELGRQHGEQAKDHILHHLDFMCTSMKSSRSNLQYRALHFHPLFKKHCPHLLEEIQGLAEGADITFADALATNIRTALNQKPQDGCTAFVVSERGTQNSEILIGQNSDMLPAMIDFGYVLHLKPNDKPQVLMWTFGGMIGYSGINDRGVCHFANDLGGGPPPCFGMPHYPLKRLIFEHETLEDIVPLFKNVPLWANGNYVLCDGRGHILDIEATTEGPHLMTDEGSGFMVHSNHFLCSPHATNKNFRQSTTDSFERLDRMTQLIQSGFGQLSTDDFKLFLRDRHGDPSGICRYAQTTDPTADWVTAGITVASIIAEPSQGQIWVAAGNHAKAPFVVYKMD